MAVRRAFKALSITDPKAWDTSLWRLAGSLSSSGEYVSEQSALTYSAVWNAVVLISGTIAALPLQLMQSNGDRRSPRRDRTIYKLLHDAPNRYMTAMAYRQLSMAHILTWGNHYSEIVKTPGGDVEELWPLPPHRVTVVDVDRKPAYRVSMPDGTVKVFPRYDILHIPGLGYDGIQGYSPIAMARKSIGLGMALETFGALYFGQGTHPGVVVSHPAQLSAQAHSNLKTSLTETYSGLGNAHRLLLLEEGMKLEKLGIPPNDSQFLESRQFQITDIARWFNIPPHKIKDLTRSSFSNIESEQRSFYTDTLLPWLVTLEQNYDLQLLTESDRDMSGRGRQYFKHNAKAILRGDAQAQSAFYSAMLDRGVLSINEVRELEDLDPVSGGDVHLVPLNMTTLENAGQPPEPPRVPSDPEPSNGNGNGVPAQVRRGQE